MSYVLFLGFKSTIYKQPPSIRLSIDDIFLDEFTIKSASYNEIDLRNEKQTIMLNDISDLEKKHHKFNPAPLYKSIPKDYNQFIDNYVDLKIFDINEKVIDSKIDHNLLIEIFNNDNNYTNGFLTKSTMIFFNIVQLIPKLFLFNTETFCDRFNSDKKKWRSTHSNISAIKESYNVKYTKFDILGNNIQKNNMLPWYNSFNNQIEEVERNGWVGGDGYFNLHFTNELVTYNDNSPKKFSISEQLLYGLANKYREYENQRNTN